MGDRGKAKNIYSKLQQNGDPSTAQVHILIVCHELNELHTYHELTYRPEYRAGTHSHHTALHHLYVSSCVTNSTSYIHITNSHTDGGTRRYTFSSYCFTPSVCEFVCHELNELHTYHELTYRWRNAQVHILIILLYTATRCNTPQYTTPRCTTLHHTATHYTTLQHTTPHCNAANQRDEYRAGRNSRTAARY